MGGRSHVPMLPLLRMACAALALLLGYLPGGAAGADPGADLGLKPDVRLLIDNSKSMQESDPDNLRTPALDLLVRLLPEGARAGVWLFGEEVEVLVPHQVVDDNWREAALKAVAAIDSSGQRSNIPAALDAASYDFDRLDPAFRTSIVLFTDGRLDVSESPMINVRAARTLLTEVAPQLGAIGVPVHTVALTDDADWVFLKSLAQSAGGIAEKAESARELSKIFLQLLEVVAPTARVPVADSRFRIDEGAGEFTVLVLYDSTSTRVSLVSPAGVRYRLSQPAAGVDWFSNRQFALATVRDPVAGEWQLAAPEGAKTRITVVSDLQLQVDPLPNSLPAGRPAELSLRLAQDGTAVTDPDILGSFAIALEISGPRGRNVTLDISRDYPVSGDGVYRVAVPPFEEPGRYRLMARAGAATFLRELPMYVDVSATPAKSTVVTRGKPIPDESLGAPLIALAGLLTLASVAIAIILNRRKRRKLEVWQRRSRKATPS